MNKKELLGIHFSNVKSQEICNNSIEHKHFINMITKHDTTSSYGKSAEEVYIEKYRHSLIRQFLHQLLRKIKPIQRKYLFTYIRNDYNTSATGESLGISKVTVGYHLKNIREQAFELVNEYNLTIPDFKELVLPEICKYQHKYSKIGGFPYEQFMNLPPNKTWVCKFGSKKFPINKSCMIPEYLENAGCPDSICTICNKSYTCTRTDKYPKNKYYTEEALNRAERIDLLLDMIADDYTEDECLKYGFKHQQVLQ